ncbi:MAG: site-specific DNA-methyltransferase [Planctomycetia bacterium]|nr:site-specific DNA-methyltransferase [Planctomycetia bacterium]
MPRAPRNRTLTLSADEKEKYRPRLLRVNRCVSLSQVLDNVICQDAFEALDFLPSGFVDLLFLDPPYNLTKMFNARSFKRRTLKQYEEWMDSWLKKMVRLLKPAASIYICGDWRSSAAIQILCEKYFVIRNRVTFEREKGRGAKNNWKNNSEDIWFCTVSDRFFFDVEAVKIKKKVLAPYRENGLPKDWMEEENGKYRLTFPSNIWTDITIPFWSMAENTPHPTQKPEKLLAKIILASSKEGDVVFDPFAGVGTTAVTAKKLKRHFVIIDIDEDFCLFAAKRLEIASRDNSIQGYSDGVFWERNTGPSVKEKVARKRGSSDESSLFEKVQEHRR